MSNYRRAVFVPCRQHVRKLSSLDDNDQIYASILSIYIS